MIFRSILPIHPSFRVLALAEPPVVGAATGGGGSSSNRGQQWLNPELLTMFLYHTVSPLALTEEMSLIQSLVSLSPPDTSIHSGVDVSVSLYMRASYCHVDNKNTHMPE